MFVCEINGSKRLFKVHKASEELGTVVQQAYIESVTTDKFDTLM
jgi:hypothetical protein